MEFQVGGDYHFTENSFKELPLKMIAKNLILTGDSVFSCTTSAYDFYKYCAQNWEKVYIIMGNQEYETLRDTFPFSMEFQYECTRYLVDLINKEEGAEKLIFIQNSYVDLPEYGLRIMGITLWADGADRSVLKKRVITDKTMPIYEFKKEEGMLIYEYNKNLSHTQSKTHSINCFLFSKRPMPDFKDNPFIIDPAVRYQSLSCEDLASLQEKETLFLEKMIEESKEKGYKLLVCSHYCPTLKIKEESPIIRDWSDTFPYSYFSRDMSTYIKEPICAWVCGHVHREQVVEERDVPIYINYTNVVTLF
jgi:hypothetical protein